MSLRRWLGRLEHSSRGQMSSIRLLDGSIYYFTQEDLKEAFLRNMAFPHAWAEGEEPPEPHPLQLALQNAAQRQPWHETYFDMLEVTGPVEDLSEP
jgi:hypothetical protein